MYLQPILSPAPPRSEWYEVSDTIATWGMFAAVLGILYLEYLTYQKGAPTWRPGE